MSYKNYYLNPKGELLRDVTEDQTKSSLESGKGLTWVDVLGTSEEDGKFLERMNVKHIR
ncbi:hypothetical protein ACFLVW_05455 [Chloroflexota bacterium]